MKGIFTARKVSVFSYQEMFLLLYSFVFVFIGMCWQVEMWTQSLTWYSSVSLAALSYKTNTNKWHSTGLFTLTSCRVIGAVWVHYVILENKSASYIKLQQKMINVWKHTALQFPLDVVLSTNYWISNFKPWWKNQSHLLCNLYAISPCAVDRAYTVVVNSSAAQAIYLPAFAACDSSWTCYKALFNETEIHSYRD